MSFEINKDELFSYFLYENGKKYYLMQKWFDGDQNDNYLKLTLTDCTNYWIKACKYICVKNLYYGLYSFFPFTCNAVSKREVEKASNLSNFDLAGIKLQFNHAFKNESRADFNIKVSHSDDFNKTTVNFRF